MEKPKLLAGLAVSAILLAACGAGGGGGEATKGTLKIGIDLPVSGSDASDGLPTQYGAQLAIKLAGKVCGIQKKDACWKLESLPLDDAVNGVHNEAKGAQNVKQFVDNADVIAMVGPLNSSVARAEIPITNEAELAQISPANTNECLTKDIPACKDASGVLQSKKLRPSGKPNNYFRTVTTDDIQGPAGADFAFDVLNKRKAFVLNDQQTFGEGIAKNFVNRFKSRGGTVLNEGPNKAGTGFDPQTTKDFKSLLNQAKNANADVVYFGGTTSTGGGIIRKQMQGILNVPFVSDDGILGEQFVKDADPNADESYFTIAGPDTNKLDSAKQFTTDFKSEYGSTPYPAPGDYSGTAFEAAKIIVAAISRAIDDAGGNKPSRAQVRDQVAKTKDFQGVLGTTSFDQFGDTTNRVITIKKWVQATKKSEFVKQIVVS